MKLFAIIQYCSYWKWWIFRRSRQSCCECQDFWVENQARIRLPESYHLTPAM